MTPSLIHLPISWNAQPRPSKATISVIRKDWSGITCRLRHKPGAKILEICSAGLGTTLFVAEELGRNPDMHSRLIATVTNGWQARWENWMQLVHGDSAKIARMGLPKMDFCMTSPPFMAKNQKWNPSSPVIRNTQATTLT